MGALERAAGHFLILSKKTRDWEIVTWVPTGSRMQVLPSVSAIAAAKEIDLESQNRRLQDALESMTQGVCLFDAQQRVVVANRRYAEIYGLTAEQAQPGTALREILEIRAAKCLDSGFDRGKFVQDGINGFYEDASEILKLADGRKISVLRRQTADGGLISTHEDITQRAELAARLQTQNLLLKQHQSALAAQNVKFDAALKNMSQGLAMFDAEQRVVIANERYAKLYGLNLDDVKPGTKLQQILEKRVAKGVYANASPQDYIKQRLAISDGPSSKVLKLSDGRTIANTGQPMPGGGWVTTHEDITEREELKDRLDAALNNMAQGLAMFDGEQRLILCNRRFVEMYGLQEERVELNPTARQILDYCVTNGCYEGRNSDEMLAATMKHLGEKASGYYITKLSAGQVYGVSVMPMSGGGIVTTHEDITERRRIEARIAHMAHHDALTDLPNRVVLRSRLGEALIGACQEGQSVAVLYLDLDGFKEVNDTLGHSVGDLLLQSVAERLRTCVGSEDLVARLGGDEFAIVQIGAGQPESAAAVATQIIQSLNAPHIVEGHLLVVSTSIGIAIAPSDGSDPETLMKNSDLALYAAKADIRGRYRFFEPAMNTRMQERRALEVGLRKSLSGSDFELYYHPILDLGTDRISGCEALLRWNHPERGLVSPAEIIPAAESSGLIVPIGEWVLREACREATTWPANLKVAVNLSAVQFKSRNLTQSVVSALAASGLAPARLELEITESVLIADAQAVLEVLKQLREVGVRIALDDFGTGYSSLSYLRSFPFHKIKIDRCFVRDITRGVPSSIAILRTVAQLGRTLGMTTTAEGVETEEQQDIVRAEGYCESQGHLLSPPVAASAVRRLISQRNNLSASAA